MVVKLATAKNKNGDIYHLKTSASQVEGLTVLLEEKQGNLAAGQLEAVNSGATTALIGKITTNETGIAGIGVKIPAQATAINQLADKDFVNSSVQTMSATPLSYNAEGAPFPTRAVLTAATEFYNGSEVKAPDSHDFVTVLADEEHGGAQTRYSFANDGWAFQFLVNDQPFTAVQNAAINSGITAAKVAVYEGAMGGMGGLLSKTEAAETYATKEYVGGLGTVYIVTKGADLSDFSDNDLIIELDA